MKDLKSAAVEICYAGGDYWFRCPYCETLNINGPETLTKCPDCGKKFILPVISLCDCQEKHEKKEVMLFVRE